MAIAAPLRAAKCFLELKTMKQKKNKAEHHTPTHTYIYVWREWKINYSLQISR